MQNYILSLLSVFGFSSNALASDFPPNVEGNRQVIQALLKHGANSSKLHPLEHHFYSSSQESLKALMKKGKVLAIDRRILAKVIAKIQSTGTLT